MRAFLIAGEPSGDALGGALMAGLKSLQPKITFEGIGGQDMTSEGLTSRFPMDELSVMGLAEVLPRYFDLKRRIRETAEAIITDPPDVVITIDSPDFCLRVLKLVRAGSDVRTVHYVAPSVWAWRPGRSAKMAKHVDQVLTLLPFEPPYMEAHGMRADFVGHPVVSEPVPTADEITAIRAEAGAGDAPLLLVLPGSRRGEVGLLGPIFTKALDRIASARPDIRVATVTGGPVAASVQDMAVGWPGGAFVLADDGTEAFGAKKRALFRAADVALAASGTVSLQLAAAATPMVIGYDFKWLTRQIMTRMMKTDTVTIANHVTGTRAVPEYLGDRCRPDLLAEGVLKVFEAPDEQTAALAETMRLLGQGGDAPGLRAARAVLDGMAQP